jgi:hypothetical protein
VGTAEEAVEDDDNHDEGMLGRSSQLSDPPSLFGLHSTSHSQFRQGIHFSLSLSVYLPMRGDASRPLQVGVAPYYFPHVRKNSYKSQ